MNYYAFFKKNYLCPLLVFIVFAINTSKATGDLNNFLTSVCTVPYPIEFSSIIKTKLLQELTSESNSNLITLFLYSLPKFSPQKQNIPIRDKQLSCFLLRIIDRQLIDLLDKRKSDLTKAILTRYHDDQELFYSAYGIHSVQYALSEGFLDTAVTLLEQAQKHQPPSFFMALLKNNKGEVLRSLTDNKLPLIKDIFTICKRYHNPDLLMLLFSTIGGQYRQTVLAQIVLEGQGQYADEILRQFSGEHELLTLLNARGDDGSTTLSFIARRGCLWFIEKVFDRCHTQHIFIQATNPAHRNGDFFKQIMMNGRYKIAACFINKAMNLMIAPEFIARQLDWIKEIPEITLSEAAALREKLLALYTKKEDKKLYLFFKKIAEYLSTHSEQILPIEFSDNESEKLEVKEDHEDKEKELSSEGNLQENDPNNLLNYRWLNKSREHDEWLFFEGDYTPVYKKELSKKELLKIVLEEI